MNFTEKEIEVRNSVVNTNNSVNNTDVYNELILQTLEALTPTPAAESLKLESDVNLTATPTAIADSENNISTLKISTLDSSFVNKVGINLDTPEGYLDIRSQSGDYITPLINLKTMAGGAPADEVIQCTFGVLAAARRQIGTYAFGGDNLTINAFNRESLFSGKIGVNLPLFTSPTAQLHIECDTPEPQIRISGAGFFDELIVNSSNGIIAGYIAASQNYTYASGVFQIEPITAVASLSTDLGIGTTTPQAALDIVSTTKGFLMPRMTEAQILLLTPYVGLQAYNTDINHICYYNGTGWRKLNDSAM